MFAPATAGAATPICVKARIDGERKCLQRGQFCTPGLNYWRYGFKCRRKGGRYRLVAADARAAGRVVACGKVPMFVSAALKVRQSNTSCRRARQIARLWQTNTACSDDSCRLYGFQCRAEDVESEHYSIRHDVTCRANGARVWFMEIIP